MNTDRKITLVAFIAIALQTQGIAQNGYKNFTFGETIEQVRAKVQGWKETEVGNIFTAAYGSEYAGPHEVPDIPHPLGMIDGGRVKAFGSEKPELWFTFIDSKLVGVDVSFFQDYVLRDLEKKYGVGATIRMTFGETGADIETWFKDADRIIVYQVYYYGGWDSEHKSARETVSYISRKTYNWLKGMVLEKEKAKRLKIEKRID